MEGGSVVFVAVNKVICPSQISSALMSSVHGPRVSKANTPPPPTQNTQMMEEASLPSGVPSPLHVPPPPRQEEEGIFTPHHYFPLPAKGRGSPGREELTLGIELINCRCVQVLIN